MAAGIRSKETALGEKTTQSCIIAWAKLKTGHFWRFFQATSSALAGSLITPDTKN